MADEKTGTDKAREIRAKLNALAPWPDTGDATAEKLARCYAVWAMERWARQMRYPAPEVEQGLYIAQISAMTAEFAAAVALAALADPLSPPLWGREGFGATSPSELASAAATQIRDGIEDGGSIGEWLWEFLGRETCEQITGLVEELDKARAEADRAVVDAGKVTFTCQSCGKPVELCSSRPPHGGCSSARGRIHADGGAHACVPGSDGPYADPPEREVRAAVESVTRNPSSPESQASIDALMTARRKTRAR